MSRNTALILSVLISSLAASNAASEQSFQLSSKFMETTFFGKQRFWDGQHRFGNVFCLKFPRGNEVESFAEAMYNQNTLYYSRAAYADMTAIYVVTSTVPGGRTVEVEIENLAAQNTTGIDALPFNFSQSKTNGLLGPSLVLTVRNSVEGGKDAPFPFVRSIAQRPDSALATLSVHRLFVHDRDRIEVAGLRYFKAPVAAEREAQEIADLSAFVEQAADSLQSCTSKLPPRP